MGNIKRSKGIIAAMILLFIFLILIYRREIPFQLSIEDIQQIVMAYGIWGALVYILIHSIRPFLFIPSAALFISGGIIFGTVMGSIYNLVGLMMAASLSFFLARRFQKWFTKLVGKKYLQKIKEIPEKEIIKSLFIMRVTPAFPFDPISFGAGLAKVSYKNFLMGTLLGSTPKVVLYTFLGDRINNNYSMETIIVFILLFSMAVISYFIGEKDTPNSVKIK